MADSRRGILNDETLRLVYSYRLNSCRRDFSLPVEAYRRASTAAPPQRTLAAIAVWRALRLGTEASEVLKRD